MSTAAIWHRWRAPWLLAAAGLVLSSAAAFYQQGQNQRLLQQRLQVAGNTAAAHMQQHLGRYLDALQGLRGVVLTAGAAHMGQSELNLYLASLAPEQELGSARSFGFVRRVARHQEAAFVRDQRSRQPDFYLREFSRHQQDRYVVQAYRSLDGGQPLLGLDLGSEQLRRHTAELAMHDGDARMTPPVMLFGSGEVRPAFLLVLPVYAGGAVPPRALRDAALLGWTYAALRIEKVVQDVGAEAGGLTFSLDDITERVPIRVLPRLEHAEADTLRASTTLDTHGRRWRLTVQAGDTYVLRQHLPSPGVVFAAGLALTAALAALLAVAAAGRRRRDEALAGQARLAAIVDSSADAIIGKDMQGRITSWNRGAERLFGHSAAQALGHTVGELLVPVHLQYEERDILRRLKAGETVPDVETQRLHRDGHLVDVWVAVAPVRHPDGSVIGAAKTVRDITERKAAELRVRAANARLEDTVAQRTAQLRDTNLMLSNVLDAATGVAIIACAVDGSITVFNRGAERMLGYHAESMLRGATPMRFHDPGEVAAYAAELSEREGRLVGPFEALVLAAERAGAETREWTYIRQDGSRLTVSLIVTAMYGAQGELSGYLGVAMDITQRHELLSSLERAKEEALAASAAKSNFLANMSHEIRTPLNAVLGMLQLVQATPLAPRQRDCLAKAGSAARALLQLLNDVLDYSKIEVGKLQLDPHPFDSDAMLRDLAVVLGGNQGGKPVELIFDLDPQLPAVLIGDRLRLQQILINLAGNALKFTERGEVSVCLRVQACSEGRLRLRVAVTDTGIGISPAQQAGIFDGFTQAEASISRRYGGTGLGLVISRRLLGLMGSSLQLDSTPGQGSCFWFEVDLGCGAPAPAPALPPCTLLIAHGHAVAGGALQRMACGLGWTATLAGDGLAALQALSLQRYDAVLMDQSLHQRATLERHAAASAQPLVLLAPGCAAPASGEVLSMPATPHMLAQAVQRALDGPAAPPQLEPAPRRLQGMRILLVEDNSLNREVAGELLGNEGAQVALAENGREGVDYLLAATSLPDVVLMDMQMPEMDGLEATQRIRAALGPALRIVAMTANAGDADRASCLAAGMDDHVGKPIDLEQLVCCLLRSAAPAPAPAAESNEAAALVLARFGGNDKLYQRALDGFAGQGRDLAAQAVAALRSGERAEAGVALHTYKGLAATLGARALAAEAAALELAVKRGETDDALLARTTALQKACAGAMQQLRVALAAAVSATAPPPAVAVAVPAQPPDGLAALLAAGNLRALEWVEQLADSGDAQLRDVAQRIQALDFPAALALLEE
ncbi:PAS domain S-box protein [Pseudoduganella sp. FT55W]|uniref:Virulence sensor protein BvgS n=1 Tax=Duganella rivi TaxID=2666083 RepID=A0A7X4GNG3_9BURK|nr:PAS domain S-box protein [Duganella rivi]MYM66686.1 PAS domain S-box protein [Duganella rivi]